MGFAEVDRGGEGSMIPRELAAVGEDPEEVFD
jgi:hypothetical protein